MEDVRIQEAARRLVQQEIHLCVSSLVYGLSQHVGELSRDAQEAIGFSEDDALQLWRKDPDAGDYRDAAPDGLTVTDGPDGWSYSGPDGETGGPFESEIEAWREAFEELREDTPDGAEIYEHWAVSDWLAEKLEARGETVARDVLGGLTVWARPTTGQAIAADWVIREIAGEFFAAPDSH